MEEKVHLHFPASKTGMDTSWRKSEILFINPVIWNEQVALFVGVTSGRDHLISRLEAAPTRGGFVIWTFRIKA